MNLDIKLSTTASTNTGYFTELSKVIKNTIHNNKNSDLLLRKIVGSFLKCLR
jgi:hypothetical protein